MWNLVKVEYLKYQRVALVLAASHILVLLYLSSIGADIARRPVFNIWLIAIFSISALFGMLQLTSHKRGNYWIYLFQRPIPSLHILLALLTAGTAILIVVCLLPYLLVISLYDLQIFYGIELRHYTSMILPALAALSAYLITAQAVLSPHRLSFIAILPGLVLLMLNRTDVSVYAGVAILISWAIAALIVTFRVDPRTHFVRPYKIMITELGVHQGLFWLYAVLLAFAYQIMWGVSGNHPVTSPAPNTAYAIAQGSDARPFQVALERSSHADREYLVQQAELSEIVQVRGVSTQSFPTRNQRPSLDSQITLLDETRNEIWRFSHSLMLFEGFDIATRNRVGWLTPNGFSISLSDEADTFSTVPWITDNTFILDDRNIYSVDWGNQRLSHRFGLGQVDDESSTERFSDSLNVSGNVATLLSNRALYVFRASELMDRDSSLAPQLVLPLSNIRTDNPRIWISELVQGYLVATISPMPPAGGIESRFQAYRAPTLTLYRFHEYGAYDLVNSVVLEPSYSDLFVYKGLILSPAMRVFADIASVFIVRTTSTIDVLEDYRNVPLGIWLLIALSMCISVGLTTLLLRRSNASRSTRTTWLIINALTCAVGVASLLISRQAFRRSTRNEAVQVDSITPKTREA